MRKYGRVVLVKEYEGLEVGQTYEIADISTELTVIRHGQTRIALCVVPTKELYEYFVEESVPKGWTNWNPIIHTDLYGASYLSGFYRTNQKKVQVKIKEEEKDYRAEASCNLNTDKFNLKTGMDLAFIRCMRKIYFDRANNALKLASDTKEMEKSILKHIK